MGKTYTVDGIKMEFDKNAFAKAFDLYCDKLKKEKGISKTDHILTFAEQLNVSESTVKAWRYAESGPMDVEMIRSIADQLDINYERLLRKLRSENKMDELTLEQVHAVKRIYDVIIEFLDNYRRTDGFAALRCEDRNVYDLIDELYNDIRLVYDKEYFYLHDSEVYERLSGFIFDLTDI